MQSFLDAIQRNRATRKVEFSWLILSVSALIAFLDEVTHLTEFELDSCTMVVNENK